MTNKEWKELEKKISMWNSEKLLIDGHEIAIRLRHVSKTELVYFIYIDGYYKGTYSDKDHPFAKKFYWKRETSVWSKKQIRSAEKALGKKWCKENGWYKKAVYYVPYFKSFSTLKRTFTANNESIEWVKDSD